ncbi:DNA-binding protein [Acidimangrovimonas sediminis]|uniref:DNA-binding protein n=1 Tax=Acidimangrovimonas sediminis TaxID=2056283 RepID=UPI000C80261B|nr:DNA-binding protein [Acidimangrovimonas sediminis]
MPKDEKNTPWNEKELKLDRRVEAMILAYQEAHDGAFPTQEEVKDELGGSFRELNPSVKRVRARLLTTQSLLATMPEMPDQLRQTGDQFMKEIWMVAREKADADLRDVRQAQAAKDEDHRRQLLETEEALFQIEEKLEAAVVRAEAGEERIKKLEAELAERTRELDALKARLEERSELFALLGRGKKEDGDVPEAEDKAKGRGKAGRGSEKNDDPETADLPMN